jgi:TRAP-type C4-dicarboxylate transport system substrate-binding protein
MGLQFISRKVVDEVFDLVDLKFRTNELKILLMTLKEYGVITFQIKNIQNPFDIELLVNVL